MSEAWPATLPARPLIEGYQESPPNVAVRTEMDAGPAKQRRRYTAGPRPVVAAVLLRSRAQLDALDEFYTDTLQGGVLPFEWLDRNRQLATFRFIAGPDALVYEVVDPEHWRATMKLEILP